MSGQSYSREVLIKVKPDSVYKAITEEINKWWTELSNQATKVGDRLTVQFEMNTYWMMTLSEAIPNQSLIWKVVEANHDVENLPKKDEWQGTVIQWEIAENINASKVTLTHQGLVPELKCFEICQSGWDYFLESLKEYLEKGKGNPYQGPD